MSELNTLLQGIEVEWKALGEVFDIYAGGDVPKEAFSEIETEEFNIQILSNGIDKKALYGWTNIPKIVKPSLTISARGTIGWTSYRDKPFFPIVRLLVLTPKIELDTKFAYYYMKSIEDNYNVPQNGIPQLTKPMVKDILFPIPPLPIQQKIVGILDKFTELTTEVTTELTARKKQYAFYKEQLFSFNDKEIEREPLGVIGEFQRGKRFVKDDMITEGVPCIHYGEMYTYYSTWANKSKSFLSEDLVESKNLRVAENGDVVIVAAGETIEDIGLGTAWLGNEGVVIHDACFSYRSTLNPKYVAYFTRTKQFHDQIKKHISSGKISAINAKGLEKVLIPIPSPEEQERIVTILDKFDILTTSISEGLPKEIELRKKQYEYYRNKLLDFSG
jgi:type I restriction enzyme, S subunit